MSYASYSSGNAHENGDWFLPNDSEPRARLALASDGPLHLVYNPEQRR